MKNLGDWVKDHNRGNPSNFCPLDILSSSCSKELLNSWLCVFVLSEIRNKSGNLYSPTSIYTLHCGIFRKVRVENPNYPNFLESSFLPLFYIKTLLSTCIPHRHNHFCHHFYHNTHSIRVTSYRAVAARDLLIH